jgi:hypothetical protein
MATMEEQIEVEIGHMSGGVAIEALSRAETDIQIATAKRYPRSIKEFKRTAMELATLDEETAASCFYSIPRAGKRIEGPSVRLAEIIAYGWTNIRAEADVVAIDDTFITAMGSCFDLERNQAARVRVKRQITDRKGKRLPDDMVRVIGQAACKIAYREAVFTVVPRALFKDVYEAARETSIGKALSMQQRRANAFEWFNKAGVSEDRVLTLLDRKGVDDTTMDDLVTLKGLSTAIKEGELSIDEAFPTTNENTKEGSRAADIDQRAAQAAEQNGGKKAEPAKSEPSKAETKQGRTRKAAAAEKAAPAEQVDKTTGEVTTVDPVTAAEEAEYEAAMAAQEAEQEQAAAAIDPKLEAVNERYLKLAVARGLGGDAAREKFERNLAAGGLVGSADRTDWRKIDFMSASAELEAMGAGPATPAGEEEEEDETADLLPS